MYYDQDTIVYYKGQYVKSIDARANVYDQSLHYGYGVFEGIRSYEINGKAVLFKPGAHFERMEYSCKAAGIPYLFSNEEIINCTYEVLSRNNLKDAYVRPLVTCSPNMQLSKGKSSELLIAAWEWGAYLGNNLLHVQTAAIRRPNPAAFVVDAKITGHYVNSILACQAAKDNGYDEALLLDVNGNVAEGPGANFFMEKNGILYTPPPGNILPGITRQTVIDLCNDSGFSVIEKHFSIEEVYGADGAFFCGTAAEVVGIASLDKHFFSAKWEETLGYQVQEKYKNLVTGKKNCAEARVA